MRGFISLAVLIALSANAIAQGTCPSGNVVPDFGYRFVSCHNCLSVLIRNGMDIPRFTGQPALHQIPVDGPGAGLLVEGDTLLAVDGLEITGEPAAIRLATYNAGTSSRLTLRRNGVQRTVLITPNPVCIGASTANFRMSKDAAGVAEMFGVSADAEAQYRAGLMSREAYERALGRYAVADSLARENLRRQYEAGMIGDNNYRERVAAYYFDVQGLYKYDSVVSRTPPIAPVSTVSLGIGIECKDCLMRRDANGRAHWQFSQLPVVSAVEPKSVAASMGVRAGDTLQTIDGMSLTTPAGGERLGAIEPGGKVTLTWRRNGKTMVGMQFLVSSAARPFVRLGTQTYTFTEVMNGLNESQVAALMAAAKAELDRRQAAKDTVKKKPPQ